MTDARGTDMRSNMISRPQLALSLSGSIVSSALGAMCSYNARFAVVFSTNSPFLQYPLGRGFSLVLISLCALQTELRCGLHEIWIKFG